MSRYDISREWLARARRVLPCDGAQTLSKGPSRNPEEYPCYIHRGKGSQVWDVDGNQYTDYQSALGPIVLGYSDPRVNKAVIDQVKKGNLFSLESPPVVRVAELLTSMIPGAEAVRFVKSGSEAVSGAVRVARAHTKRPVVLVASNSYHGSHDFFQVTQALGRNGVPANLAANIRTFEYNDTDSLEAAFIHAPGPVAAVLLEPARTFVATPTFLNCARELCDKYGALLIYDEVVTFGRFNGMTAAACCGVKPDLMALGKAMANGYALGAVVGPWRYMETFNHVFISGTYNGELTAMAAAEATLTVLKSEPVVEHIERQGRTLMAGFEAAVKQYDLPAYAEGIPVCHRQTFTGPQAHDLKMRFMAECTSRGVLPGLITYPTYAHTDADVQRTVEVFHEVAEVLAKEVLENPGG